MVRGGRERRSHTPDLRYLAAHFSVAAMVFSSSIRAFDVRKIEKSTTPECPVAVRRMPVDEVLADTGAITMLPALTPAQTVSRSDGRRSARPHTPPIQAALED